MDQSPTSEVQPAVPFYRPLSDSEVHDLAWADMRGELWATWKLRQNRELLTEITLLVFPSLLFLRPDEYASMKEHNITEYCQYSHRAVANPIGTITKGAIVLPSFAEVILVSKGCHARIERYKKHLEKIISENRPMPNVPQS